jgi:hypothetical protein
MASHIGIRIAQQRGEGGDGLIARKPFERNNRGFLYAGVRIAQSGQKRVKAFIFVQFSQASRSEPPDFRILVPQRFREGAKRLWVWSLAKRLRRFAAQGGIPGLQLTLREPKRHGELLS